MQFLASLISPAAGAAGPVFRVQLPAVGRVAPAIAAPRRAPVPAARPAGGPAPRPPGGQSFHRASHRAQCLACCQSKGC
ncbi:hypothetical protein ACFQ48_07165 [Hymenobacter caeli]|uniref:Secreted protein n=1 Tax=Hymenobacter caeli TaxID=2735894 RepID=A0ABX2FRC1_9BACT|nr:hypothetical protein [Hymenobacter caeli]NRT18965.1 hypothetical protein [Hymenobacter caeli]